MVVLSTRSVSTLNLFNTTGLHPTLNINYFFSLVTIAGKIVNAAGRSRPTVAIQQFPSLKEIIFRFMILTK